MKLSKQRANLDVRKFSFSERVVQEWNKLLQEVVDATSVNKFKNRLDKHWKRYGLTSPSSTSVTKNMLELASLHGM